jgi:tRNA pseudouridine13 synthase
VTTLPYVTARLPGCGGTFKATPEDFLVEELPAYELSAEVGSDEHLFVWVDKRGHSTQDVAKAIARHCGITERDVTWAGLKDRQAVTRQYLCMPARLTEEKLASFSMEGVTLLRQGRHRNKLKTGHLHGNKFELVVRGVESVPALEATLAALRSSGLPNFYGEQRFGASNNNAARGKALLLRGGKHRDRFERKMLLSAYQSELFNRVLTKRLERGLFAKALLGDVLKKHETGGEFVCADVAVDQLRVDAFEVSPMGPMFGPEMRAAEADAAALEAEVLAAENVTLATFEAGGDESRGTRRVMRIPFDASSEVVEGGVKLTFTLPAGSYATVVLRELLKQEERPGPLAAVPASTASEPAAS